MIKKLKAFIVVAGIALGIGMLSPLAVGAESVIDEQCTGVAGSAVCAQRDDSPEELVKNIVNTLLFLVGAISVIMIIVGGIMYATSSGDAGRVTLAKNTVTYAVIGVVVSFIALAIVQFVVSRIV